MHAAQQLVLPYARTPSVQLAAHRSALFGGVAVRQCALCVHEERGRVRMGGVVSGCAGAAAAI